MANDPSEEYVLDVQRIDADFRDVDAGNQSPTDLATRGGFGSVVRFDEDRLLVSMPVAEGFVDPSVSYVPGFRNGRITVFEKGLSGLWEPVGNPLRVDEALIGFQPNDTIFYPRDFGRALDASGGLLAATVLEAEEVGFFGFLGGAVLAEWNSGLEEYETRARVYRSTGAFDDDPLADFGQAIAVNDSHLVISAPNKSVSFNNKPGLLYFAEMSDLLVGGSAITDVAIPDARVTTLSSPSPVHLGQFGHSLRLSGDILVVGAPGETSAGVLRAGRTHVFEWNGTSWSLAQTLEANVPVADGRFGFSNDLYVDQASGDVTILIGSPSDAAPDRSGRAEVWRRSSGSSTFVREASISDADALASGETPLEDGSFAYSVEILDADRIVIGRTNSLDLQDGNANDTNPWDALFNDSLQLNSLYPYALEPSGFVFGFQSDGQSGSWQLERALVPSRVNLLRSWVGFSMASREVSAGVFELAMGDPLGSAFAPGLGSAFVFDPLAAAVDVWGPSGTPDGVADAWQIKQDILDGFPDRLDLDGDGRVDMESAGCDLVRQVVLVVDSSTSTILEDPTYFEEVLRFAKNIGDTLSDAEVTVLAVGAPFEADLGSNGGVRSSDGNPFDYSNIVPRSEPGPGGGPWIPSPGPGSMFPGSVSETGFRLLFAKSNFEFDDDDESWATSTAIVAEHFPWRSSYRVIIPISDEPGHQGENAALFGYFASANANGVLHRNGVRVLPLITASSGTFSDAALDNAMIITGDLMGTSQICTTVNPSICFQAADLDIVGEVFTIGTKAAISEQGLSSGGVGDPTLADALLALPAPTGCCAGDANGDGSVDLADLNLVLANFGTTTTVGDVTGDGVVDLADLNLVLANFGTNCNAGTAQSFSMSMADPQELPVTVWLMLEDHPNADSWINHIQQFAPAQQKQSTDSLKQWVDDWEAGLPE
ncbi:MAG: hypothetical protein ACF788_08950 [Novipirellula sp. JB048]